MTKICKTCGIEKAKDQFGVHSGRADGLNDDCKECRKVKSKADYLRRKDTIKANNNAYYHENKHVYYARKDKHKHQHTEEYYTTTANNVKVCACCSKEKTLIQFTRDTSKSDGYKAYCSSCQNEMNREYYSANKPKERARNKKYKVDNKEYNQKYENEYQKNRRAADPTYRLKHNIRTRFTKLFKGKTKSFHSVDAIGCSIEELKSKLEALFQPGMTMENYGEWEVDHVIPLSSAKTEQEILQLWHYSNLQPLWSLDNQKKGSKY